jgi:hypothetical protein
MKTDFMDYCDYGFLATDFRILRICGLWRLRIYGSKSVVAIIRKSVAKNTKRF